MRIIVPASRIVNQGNVAAWTSAEAEIDDDELAPFAALTAVAFSPMDRRVVLSVRDDGVCEAVGARTRDAHRQALEARLLTSQAPLLAACPKAAMIPLPVLRAHPARVDREREELFASAPESTAPSDRTAARYVQLSLRCTQALARCSEQHHCSGHVHQRSDDLHQRSAALHQGSAELHQRSNGLYQHSGELHQQSDDLQRRYDDVQHRARELDIPAPMPCTNAAPTVTPDR